MKRNFTVWDGLFILFLAFKLNGTGPDLTWLQVFSVYILQAFLLVIFSLSESLGFTDRLKFFYWKGIIGVRVWFAAGKAKREVMESYHEAMAKEDLKKSYLNRVSGNPGIFVDPAKKGK